MFELLAHVDPEYGNFMYWAGFLSAFVPLSVFWLLDLFLFRCTKNS
jgi:hypothetical protein